MERARSVGSRFVEASVLFLLVEGLTGCVTKADLRREQEVDRLKQELKDARGDRADMDNTTEDLRMEITRMSNLLEERAQAQRIQADELKKEIVVLTGRLAQMEERLTAEQKEHEKAAERPKNVEEPKRPRDTYEAGKALYDEGQYDEAIEVLKNVAKQRRSDDGKKAQFLLAECYFANRDYATAVLEYSEFRKIYPKDSWIPNAIYRQANAFKNMSKRQEAKLFYQELIEKFPKNQYAGKARQELKKLK